MTITLKSKYFFSLLISFFLVNSCGNNRSSGPDRSKAPEQTPPEPKPPENPPVQMTPVVSEIKWGSVTIKNKDGSEIKYKDCILTPEISFEWNFKTFGHPKNGEPVTSHQHKTDLTKGIQIHSVRDLLDKGDIFILSTGMTEDLGVHTSTVQYLKNKNKKVQVLKSDEAAKKHNELVKSGLRVVTLLHSTC